MECKILLGRYRKKYQKICIAKFFPISFPPTECVKMVVNMFAKISGEIIISVVMMGRQRSHHTESTEKESPRICPGARQFG